MPVKELKPNQSAVEALSIKEMPECGRRTRHLVRLRLIATSGVGTLLISRECASASALILTFMQYN
jgi:hypothetical protein